MEKFEEEIVEEISKIPAWVKLILVFALVPMVIVGILVFLLRLGFLD